MHPREVVPPPRPFRVVTGTRLTQIQPVRDMLLVSEIFLSLQGESTFAGLPCVFVRLTGCNLRCSYCDTAYAFTGGRQMPVTEVLEDVLRLAAAFAGRAAEMRCPTAQTRSPTLEAGGTTPTPQRVPESVGAAKLPLVEVTGGEPLLQPAVLPLLQALCDRGFTVLLETSGALDIAPVDPRVRRIVDLKCPGSGEVARNRWENLAHLKATDQLKFVIGSVEDYQWVRQQIAERRLATLCPLLFSWAHPLSADQRDRSLKPVPPGQTPLSRRALAERLLADGLPVRFQAQLHKIIWPPDQRGV